MNIIAKHHPWIKKKTKIENPHQIPRIPKISWTMVKSVWSILSELWERSVWSLMSKINQNRQIHIRYWEFHIRFLNRIKNWQNLCAQLHLSSENDGFRVSTENKTKIENPHQIFRNPRTILKISKISRILKKTARSTPSELGERAFWSW